MIRISRTVRSFLYSASIGMIVIPSLGLERVVRAAVAPRATPAQVLTVEEPSAPPEVAKYIRKDPFAGAPSESAGKVGSLKSIPLPSLKPGRQSGVIVPDIASAMLAQTLYVKATIVSRDPARPSIALLQNGQSVNVVRIGDFVGQRRVIGIDTTGILLSDHSYITVAAGSSPTLPDGSSGAPSVVRTPPPSAESAVTGAAAGVPAAVGSPSVQNIAPYVTPKPYSTPFGGVPTINPTPYTFEPTPNPNASMPIYPRGYPWLAPTLPQPNGQGGTVQPSTGQ